jgi:two-component system response regulator GlrR
MAARSGCVIVFSNNMRSERALIIDSCHAGIYSEALRDLLVASNWEAPSIPAPHRNDPGPDFDSRIIDAIRRYNPRVIFSVSSTETIDDCKTLLGCLKRLASNVPLIAVIDSAPPDQAFELLQVGAADFITPPFIAADVLPRAWRLIGQASEVESRKPCQPQLRQLIGESAEFLQETNKIPFIAGCEANVLIIGETGTGKELYARAIHYSSPRAGKPFMPVNCGAIPVELVENELFGHARGAFTSATSFQVGLIEEANGGTLFLDEIDCLPVHGQVKLLRFLQEKEYRPLGSPKMRHADVRVIAATNLNLPEAVDNGKVRQDLFYRLNIISLTIPPLRDRRDDIPLLARHFLAKYSREFQKQVTSISDEGLQRLMIHSWPGNVREIEHVIERAIVMCEGDVIQVSNLMLTNSEMGAGRESLQQAKAKEIARFEKSYIQGVLALCRGNITKAAQVAQKNRRAFWQLIQKHQIDVKKFRPAPAGL